MAPNQSRPWFLIRWLYRRLRFALWHLVDRALGVRTTFVESTGAWQADTSTANQVKPCAWLTVWRLFRWLEVGPDDVLVDFGSGTGRAVLIASLFPFRRVVGIERQAALHERALNNLARFRLRRRAPVELVCVDALDYPLPDDVTVVFLYNPFNGPTFERVVEGVLASVERVPRRLRLVYVNPAEAAWLAESGRWRRVKTLDGLRPTRDWARMLAADVYEATPPPAATAAPEAAPALSAR